MDTFYLVARGLSHDNNDSNSSNSKHVCPTEDTSGPDIVPFVGSLTYHQFATILSGACGIVCAVIACFILTSHAINYSNPVQQRQVIRIILLIPWIALWAFLIVWQDAAGEYFLQSLDFGCAIALSSFLLLMCDFILAHRDGFDDLFGQGALERGALQGDSPKWLKRRWYSVLQFIPTSIIVWLATAISLAVGTYCKQSNSIHFAHIWIAIIKFIVTVIAIVAVIRFYIKNKAKLHQHNIWLKLFTFKGIIGLNILQSFIISILVGRGVLKPSKYLTYHDVNTSLAALILACEMPIFAALLLVAFPATPYKKAGGPVAGPMSAIFDAFNISDLLSAFIRGPMRLVRNQQSQISRWESQRMEMTGSPTPEQRKKLNSSSANAV